MLSRPYSQNNDRERHYSVRSQLTPGSFLHGIVYGKSVETSSRKPFYVQNHQDYLNTLERNYKYYGVPFKKPDVKEIPDYVSNSEPIENHIEYLDKVILNLNVLKNGKVRVKLLTQMVSLNEKYYSKAKAPPFKTLLSTLKTIGYSKEYLDIISEKHKKKQKLIQLKWKELEKYFDAPSVSSKSRKKLHKKKEKEKEKEEKEDDKVEESDDENEEKDEELEDEGMDMEQDEEEVTVDEEYISDGGDD